MEAKTIEIGFSGLDSVSDDQTCNGTRSKDSNHSQPKDEIAPIRKDAPNLKDGCTDRV